MKILGIGMPRVASIARAAFISSAFCLAACGGSSNSMGSGGSTSVSNDPVQACNDVVATECKRIYECVPSSLLSLAMLPPDEATCVMELAQQLACASATSSKVCAGNQNLTVAQASKCVSEASAAQCAQITANGKNVGAYAPDCGQCALQ